MMQDSSRRSTYRNAPLSYVEVGASRATDLLKFPPNGAFSFEESVWLGKGEKRFVRASAELMSWGAQRGAGMLLSNIVVGEGSSYHGPEFDADGTPHPAEHLNETHFAPDGTPYLTVGTTVTLQAGKNPERTMLVTFAEVGERRVEFALGTCDARAEVGEQAFSVQWREDNSVWATVRGFFVSSSQATQASRRGVDPSRLKGLVRGSSRVNEREIVDRARAQIRALASTSPGVKAPEPSAASSRSDNTGHLSRAERTAQR